MEVHDAIRTRKSVRAYDPRPIPDEVLERILEAGRTAPSANNRQPWKFIVVKDQANREKLTDGKYAKFLKDCPVVIAGCGDTAASPEWCVVDTTIALENMVLAATAEGVGTCWIGSFYEDKVKSALKIPGSHKVVAMLAVGYPKDKDELSPAKPRKHNRKAPEEIFYSEEFGRS